MVLVQKKPISIYMGGKITDMQGPCPSGFHVPTMEERNKLVSIGTTLGVWSDSSGTPLATYLKRPMNGFLNSDGATILNRGTYAYYWSTDKSSSSNAKGPYFSQSFISNSGGGIMSAGRNIRPFKDAPVMPDSGWTALYSDKIYHNSTLGLISLSSDGTNWITIADKNLGATTVYNYGDTLSQSNCGYYYQWGNNTGFPFHGIVSTDDNQVDASNYGPGNYYSSSTFITASPRDSSDNKNLRGGVSSGTKSIKKVYLGSTQVRPIPTYKTYTISWTEQSNMSSGWTYSDDATGMTAGSTAFDEFFGYSAVRLNTSGVETAEVTQSTPGTLDITQLGTLYGGDNIMIKFPVRGIKMSKNGSVVTLSITEELNKTGYQYFAHTSSGNITSPGTPKDAFYIGAYESCNSSNVLKSWSGQSPAVSIAPSTLCTYAKANGSGWNTYGFYQRMYINALYIMKYGNPYSQSVIGNGYVSGSSAQTTGATNSISTATGATSTANNGRIKLFGLEDWWGNIDDAVGGVLCYSNNVYAALTGWGGERSPTSIHTSIATYGSKLNGFISAVGGTNNQMFLPIASNGNDTTYYTDYSRTDNNVSATAGGNFGNGANAGVFGFWLYNWNGGGGALGARLLYL